MRFKSIAAIAIAAVLLLSADAFAQNKKKKKTDTQKNNLTQNADTQGKKKKKGDTHKDNLIENGDFESGKGRTPPGWAKFDGITQKWDQRNGYPGKCLLLDTSVLQQDKKDFVADEEAFKNRKKKNTGGQYDVVGAHEGAWAYANPIDVKPTDTWFAVSADVSCPSKSSVDTSSAIIFVRGFVPATQDDIENGAAVWYHHYFGEDKGGYEDMFGSKDLIRKPRKGDWRQVYRLSVFCRVHKADTFEHIEQAFKLPKEKRFRPSRILIKPYAFWPVGEYRFDNITVRRCSAEEAKAINDSRPSVNEFE